jgi:succinate-semialdehyde dehydrogenase/glutarate-semialdehyde dehydrogenase
VRRLFFSSSDPARPRAGWRLIVFVGIWMVSMLLLMVPAGIADYATGGAMFGRDTPTESQHLAFALVGMAAALIASRLSARFIDRRPIADYGLRFNALWWRDYGFGLFIGAAQMLFVFVVLLGGDWIDIESIRFTSAVALSLALSFALHFAVGFGEELFTRGAPLVMLEEGFRWRRVPQIAASMIALLVTSTVFGLMHAGNPNASSISNVNLIVAGIALAIPVLLTRQLAISMGAHTTWNFLQGAVLGFPVSGQDVATPLIDSEPTGPLYLTGGAFGPEAGVLTSISEVLFVAAVIVYVKRTRGAARILPPPEPPAIAARPAAEYHPPAMPIASINPATGETVATFEALTADDIERKLQRAAEAFELNRARSFAERAERMRKAADILESRAEQFARLITLEMGKPITAAVAEVKKCANVCRHYAEHAETYLAPEHIQTDAQESYVRFDPLGCVLAVMPWNFPFWQVFRFAAPALMAGNVGLLKHASNVPQCALAIEDILREAGFDRGEFQTLLITSEQVAALLDDERVKAATLTGSEPAGASVASNAARRIKKSVLELGGSDPFVVMPSADLDAAVKTGIKARIVNNGQSCIAAKRFIVHESIADEFESRFVAAMEALTVGDPMSETTDVGPLATPQIVDDIEKQVEASVAAGAKLLAGGKRLRDRGYFYAPTILRDIPEEAPAYAEETFGPVASLFRVQDAEAAVRLANATPFGLGASVWTNDRDEAERFIAGIESGQVFVNAMVASDPRIPFGGVKHSGFGRELGVYGIREFVNIKTVWIAK